MRVEAAYQNGRDSTTDYHYDEKALVCIGDGPLAQSLEYDTRGKLVAIHQGSVRRVLDPPMPATPR
jgi:hypothetical protein